MVREDIVEQVRDNEERATQTVGTNVARALRAYEAAVETSPNLVVGIDARGKIRLFNHTAQAISGYAKEDVLGASFVEVLIPEERRHADGAIVDALLTSASMQRVEDGSLITRSGKLRDMRWWFTRVEDGGPDEIVLIATGADVTDTLAASRQLRQHERLVALGTLAAGLAHEIRNPLNGALLHVSFLERGLEQKHEEPELLEAARVVGDEIKRLARLVSEFLDFARPNPLAKRWTSVRAIVERALESTASNAAQGSVTIDTDFPPHDLIVLVDGPKLEQVVINIVENAIEALTARASGHIVVRARRQPRHVLVEIEDDGPGFSSSDAPVFDAFFSTKHSGTGLGLPITHRIVTDHGGTVDAESRPGRTCVRFTIPIDGSDVDGEGR
jgi:PAS domain S-box-containing protein